MQREGIEPHGQAPIASGTLYAVDTKARAVVYTVGEWERTPKYASLLVLLTLIYLMTRIFEIPVQYIIIMYSVCGQYCFVLL